MAKNKFLKAGNFIWKMSGNAFNRQVGIFLIFLVISAVLWVVTSLNEVMQRQIEYNLEIRNIPDSVTFIKTPPAVIVAEIEGRGTHLLRNLMGRKPVLSVDFNAFAKDSRFTLSKRTLLDLLQSSNSDGRQIRDIIPDSVVVYYSTRPPRKIAVKSDIHATAANNFSILGLPVINPDSVNIFTAGNHFLSLPDISTRPIYLSDLTADTKIKVPLSVPAGCRVIPDSIEVSISVEPIVTETRILPVEAENVPYGYEAVLRPRSLRTSFRIPRSRRNNLPEVKLIADFINVKPDTGETMIAVTAIPMHPNVFVEKDSVSFSLQLKGKTN